MANKDFLEECNRLIKSNTDLKSEYMFAEKSALKLREELNKSLDKLEAIPIPEVEGKPVYKLVVNREKLGDYAYVKELASMLPVILNGVETSGLKLIEKVM